MKIVTPEQMSRLDRYIIENLKIPGIVLMENAALAVANKALDMLSQKTDTYVVVFCGIGNNGGDGFAVARILENNGVKTTTYVFGNTASIKGDAKTNYDININMKLDIKQYSVDIKEQCVKAVKNSDLTVDALLGTGFNGPLRNGIADAISIINTYSKMILSIDIPSGVNGADGSVPQDAVRAHETVTFCLPKIGLCVYPGHEYAGRITVANIQIPKNVVEEQNYTVRTIDLREVKAMLPRRRPDGNKGDYGRVMVIGGQKGMTGAVILAAKAAYRTGSGLVYIKTSEADSHIYETTVIEAVKIIFEDNKPVHDQPEHIIQLINMQDCFVIGPGMGKSLLTLKTLEYFLSLEGKNIVLDADALNVLEGRIDLLKNACCNVAVTPHPGEMSRLCGISIEDIQKDRLAVAKQFSEHTGVITVLKGAATIVTDPGGSVLINTTGCGGMSTAGSGDVLAGMIGSLSGQGVDLIKACTLGVYLHGLAGEYAGKKYTEYGMTASDIIEMIPAAYMEIGNNYCEL